ncbi:hypothetical protein [Phaeodactylibacter luteus]|uniref:Aspartyl protease n=1 Tax=Phaeodactylibacter luteus TaxID=1564516 RepID=A0A5C6RK52_9BACT|nr:hypothetical protein [Phaeodactylibacter luteus]TXB62573.1 hypothetical protein FRY97_13215 [Phaeodactylibacter luteus]
MASKFNFTALALMLFTLAGAAQDAAFELDVEFRNQLIYTQIPSAGGTLQFLANTTGGAFVCESAMQEHALPSVADDNGNQFVKINEVLETGALPTLKRNSALVLPDGQANLEKDVHGMLGQSWFGQFCWNFDYRSEMLTCHAPALSPLEANTIPVDFKESASGNRISSLPRIFIEVDGMPIPVILDSGARMRPAKTAAAILGETGEEVIAASFIIESIFEQWEQLHPDWRVIEQADAELGNVRMIEVPQVTIAGQKAGPVWFCSRPDANYVQYYSRMCGSDVEGALGGNALQYFSVTIDYPNKLAKFEQ